MSAADVLLRASPPLTRGELLVPGYEVVDLLSRGNALDVYDVWSRDRECRCIAKVPRPDRLEHRRTVRRLRTEGWLLGRLRHPHIVTCYEVVEGAVPAVILEMLTGSTVSYVLDEMVERLTVEESAWLGVQLCSAIGYLHRHGWLHLDLKPANIVAESGTAKLIDLSIARKPGPGPAGIGTREHMSPEQAAGGVLSEASDVWGIASVLFECLAGRLPFEDHMGEKGEKRYPQLEMAAPSLGRYLDGPAGLIEAIDAGLRAEPARRPSVAALSRALQESAGIDPRAPRVAP